jgi:hypothetical protein
MGLILNLRWKRKVLRGRLTVRVDLWQLVALAWLLGLFG